ncbi:hypothetical protein OG453_39825 [Streptomyces sp. NBC_01381]|uniref:hypothetical protein n=1 Tax=Streptomyces sp. NBC_01381 TaxID=2903845 RepID=UPI0022529D4E|nr:hypothetical protein [Streptomyces sp. NBC_01381]MCX4672723.1 hypothetical protein [Streptomyces sp. NBC_01381]
MGRGLEVLVDVEVSATDREAYEAFITGKLSGLPAVLRLESHLTMKKIKADG